MKKIEVIPLNHIYTGLDIGNDQIKIVVAEAEGSDFYVLASTSIRSTGMKKIPFMIVKIKRSAS